MFAPATVWSRKIQNENAGRTVFLTTFSITHAGLLNNEIMVVFSIVPRAFSIPVSWSKACLRWVVGLIGLWAKRDRVVTEKNGTTAASSLVDLSMNTFSFVPGFVPFSRKMFLFPSKCSFFGVHITCMQAIFVDLVTLMPHEHVVDFSRMQVIFGHLFLFHSKCPSNVPACSRKKGTAKSFRINGSRHVCSFVPSFLIQRLINNIYIGVYHAYKGFPNKAGTEEQILDLGVLGVMMC
jgi:hypothetical protein